jgi:hypothetical protein
MILKRTVLLKTSPRLVVEITSWRRRAGECRASNAKFCGIANGAIGVFLSVIVLSGGWFWQPGNWVLQRALKLETLNKVLMMIHI